MESQRSFLLIGLAVVSFLLWQQWQIKTAPKPVGTPSVQQVQADTPIATDNTEQMSDVPQVAADKAQVVSNETTGQLVTVKTDTLNISIDTRGGDVVRADLMDYAVTQKSAERFNLLRNDADGLYIAQSGLIGPNGPDSSKNRAVYSTTQTAWELEGDSLTVPLTLTTADGLQITKNFIFTRGKHDVLVQYVLSNQSDSNKQVRPYTQLKQAYKGAESGGMFMPTYRGAAYSTDQVRYEKYTFEDIQEARLDMNSTGGWVAMLEHYFVSAWVPAQDQNVTLFSRNLNNVYGTIGYTQDLITLAPGDQVEISNELYIGPKDQDSLEKLARGLDLTVDYGIFWWLSQPLFWLLKFLHSFLGNWGLAIIVITILVKGAMYPLTKKQYESMGKMRAIQPKMQALKDKYGDDRQKMSQAMMELYRKEKVNPMGGCFPLLLQMPIFLALYYMFLESVELRHAEFYLWIADLSVKDPYYILPILMGVSMYALQKLNPVTVQDPMQQKIMQWMPVVMTVFFVMFPAGLVLYWLVSNLITLVQAKMIYASMRKRGIAVS